MSKPLTKPTVLKVRLDHARLSGPELQSIMDKYGYTTKREVIEFVQRWAREYLEDLIARACYECKISDLFKVSKSSTKRRQLALHQPSKKR